MKKILVLLFALSAVFMFIACDDSSDDGGGGGGSSTAEFRLYNGYYYGRYLTLGTYQGGSTYSLPASWVYAYSGGTSSYTDIEEGTYYPLIDHDSYHSSFDQVFTPTVTVEGGESYTFYLDSSGSSMSMSQD